MHSKRRHYSRLIAAALVVVALALLASSVVPTSYAQTVPTITPTSPPSQDPSPTPGGGGPPPTSQPPPATSQPPSPTASVAATSTRLPGSIATATSTRRVTPGASPTALFSGTAATLATAEACSLEPTIRVSSGGAWIYEGPGQDYDQVGRLAAATVRPLVGRAESVAWWLIALERGEVAWIADNDVTVQGDPRDVAIVRAAPLPDGATPTPGPTWAPTPDQRCAEPTPTATATAAELDTPTASPSPSPTVAPRETATSTPEVEAAPLTDDEDGDGLFWLPVAGIVLLAAGAFLFVTRRS